MNTKILFIFLVLVLVAGNMTKKNMIKENLIQDSGIGIKFSLIQDSSIGIAETEAAETEAADKKAISDTAVKEKKTSIGTAVIDKKDKKAISDTAVKEKKTSIDTAVIDKKEKKTSIDTAVIDKDFIQKASGGLIENKYETEEDDSIKDPSNPAFESKLDSFIKKNAKSDTAVIVSEDTDGLEVNKEADVEVIVDGEVQEDASGCNDILMFGLTLIIVIYIVYYQINY